MAADSWRSNETGSDAVGYACSRCHDLADGRLKADCAEGEIQTAFAEGVMRTLVLLHEKGLIGTRG